MRLISVCAALLLLAGCAESSLTQSGALSGSGGSSPRPKMVVVTDLVISPDLVIVDRGFTARLERKIGAYPTHERKQRTLERVNDEIVATIVATLRENGLDAQPGSEEGLSLSESAMLVTGRLRAPDGSSAKNEYGIGGGKSGVIADMSLSSFGSLGKRQLMTFNAEAAGGRAATGRAAAAGNALIAEALASTKAAPEKLSPDVEVAARRIGRGAADKVVAYGRTQGWFNNANEGAAVSSAPAVEAPAPVAATPALTRTAAAPTAAAPVAAASVAAAARPAATRAVARPARAGRAPAPEMIPDENTELDKAAPAGD
ncbi:MAG: hypothetical protein Q7T81_06680 [Pseudolabrys sp.]|nr:hypothetical protein [Pseudolabrys sp.]